ncbi:CBS domain-containing protein, partial [Morganella morganii]
VWDSHKGEFIGLLHIKDLLLALSALDSLPETFDLDELVRPLEIVTKHTPLSRLLEQFRKGGAHFAVVEEADHKVVGFLTMEDVLEVLVGDIQDEHRK